MNHSDNIKRAIAKYSTRKNESPKNVRRNKAPEKLVQLECTTWMKENDFSYDIIEAKASYSYEAQRYTSSHVKPGFPDCVACDTNGYAIYIEFKSPGRMSTLRPVQREFLINKINNNAFACVTDSAKQLEKIYTTWLKIKRGRSISAARNYLLNELPKMRKDNSSIF